MKNKLLTILCLFAAAIIVWAVFFHTPPDGIKIGAVLPLTGEAALLGEWGANGMNLAEEYINKNGGINGKPLRVVIEDGMGNPQLSVNAFKKLKDHEKVKVIFSIISSVDLAIIPLLKDSSVFFLSHATHPKISGIHPLVFRHSPTVQQEVWLIDSLISAKEIEKVTLLYMNDDYGFALSKLLAKRISKGGEKLSLQAFPKGETDYRAIVTKALMTQPELIVIAGTGRNLGQLIVKLKEMSYQGDILVTLGFIVSGAKMTAGKSIQGVYGIDFDIDTMEQGYAEVNRMYRDKYGSDIPTGSLIFFNSVLLLSSAIKSAGYNPVKISQYLRKIRSFQGMGERMRITKTNDILPSLKITRFSNDG